MGRRQVEPTFIDFSEVGEQRCGGGAIPSNECGEIVEQNWIGEMGKCVRIHGSPRMQTAHPVAGAMNDLDRITAYFDALAALQLAPNATLQTISRQSSASAPVAHPVRLVALPGKLRRFVDK